jgi:hypothetical protein
MPSPSKPPVGVVGRVLAGRNQGFYVEVDDDTRRAKGSGGYYILWWTGAESYDDWVESWQGVVNILSKVTIEWMDAEQSKAIPGRHRHDTMSLRTAMRAGSPRFSLSLPLQRPIPPSPALTPARTAR